MSGMKPPTEDIDARGQGLAHSAVLALMLRIAMDKGLLPRSETEQHLKDIIGMFQRPGCTDAELIAGRTVQNILENASEPLPAP